MPHRTFAQVAKRRLTGKEGRERIREVQAVGHPDLRGQGPEVLGRPVTLRPQDATAHLRR